MAYDDGSDSATGLFGKEIVTSKMIQRNDYVFSLFLFPTHTIAHPKPLNWHFRAALQQQIKTHYGRQKRVQEEP